MVHAADADDLRLRLRAALDGDPIHEAPPGDRLAAVLAPLVLAPIPSLVFTVRASGLSRHPGEISFPGGLLDPGERLAEAALREAEEEIGLDPRRVDLLGALPPIHTHVSGILVVPFVGVVASPVDWVVNHGEIAEVLSFAVSRLAAAEAPMELARAEGGVWRGWAYDLDGHTIWGATGWMLHTLLEVMKEETPWMVTGRAGP
jgi:8-oxo-dGTP pyrophosphatase MutT (NUDIX family)